MKTATGIAIRIERDGKWAARDITECTVEEWAAFVESKITNSRDEEEGWRWARELGSHSIRLNAMAETDHKELGASMWAWRCGESVGMLCRVAAQLKTARKYLNDPDSDGDMEPDKAVAVIDGILGAIDGHVEREFPAGGE